MTHQSVDRSNFAAMVMIFTSFLALVCSNTALNSWYCKLLDYVVQIKLMGYVISFSVSDFVKEFLMSFFFFNITLELKKEFFEGVLTDKEQFILPLIATIGGMIMPAALYILINYNYPENIIGFAIPCATDIAFAMCIFNLIAAKSFSPAIKIFLLSIAIFDDLGSMLIIALFYNTHFSILAMFISLIALLGLVLLHKRNITIFTPYLFLGAVLWLSLYQGGINPTLSGVLTGICIPMYKNANNNISPLKKLQIIITPYVEFCILPIFAFVASGVSFIHLSIHDLFNPVSLGIIIGLFFGKQLGITLFSAIAVWIKIAKLPKTSNWFEVYFVSSLAGIGFTMSLFIGCLAFEDKIIQDYVKIAIITSSIFTTIYSIIISKLSR